MVDIKHIQLLRISEIKMVCNLIVAVASAIIWDITTLMLYICKIRMFTKSAQGKDDKVKNRILSILNKLPLSLCFMNV